MTPGATFTDLQQAERDVINAINTRCALGDIYTAAVRNVLPATGNATYEAYQAWIAAGREESRAIENLQAIRKQRERER